MHHDESATRNATKPAIPRIFEVIFTAFGAVLLSAIFKETELSFFHRLKKEKRFDDIVCRNVCDKFSIQKEKKTQRLFFFVRFIFFTFAIKALSFYPCASFFSSVWFLEKKGRKSQSLHVQPQRRKWGWGFFLLISPHLGLEKRSSSPVSSFFLFELWIAWVMWGIWVYGTNHFLLLFLATSLVAALIFAALTVFFAREGPVGLTSFGAATATNFGSERCFSTPPGPRSCTAGTILCFLSDAGL